MSLRAAGCGEKAKGFPAGSGVWEQSSALTRALQAQGIPVLWSSPSAGTSQLCTDPQISHWGLAKSAPSQGPSPHIPARLGAEVGVLGQTASFLQFHKALSASCPGLCKASECPGLSRLEQRCFLPQGAPDHVLLSPDHALPCRHQLSHWFSTRGTSWAPRLWWNHPCWRPSPWP